MIFFQIPQDFFDFFIGSFAIQLTEKNLRSHTLHSKGGCLCALVSIEDSIEEHRVVVFAMEASVLKRMFLLAIAIFSVDLIGREANP